MKKIFFIVLFFLCNSCYKDVNKYILDNRYSILSVNASLDSVPADGKSIVTIMAKITQNADFKTVQFTTTNGNFLDSSVTYTSVAHLVGDSLIAKAFLVSSLDTTGYVFVHVIVPGLDTLLNLKFTTALPDSIHIESSINNIPRAFGSQVPLQTRLIRYIGTPSKHQTAYFNAIRSDSSRIGNFIGISQKGSDSVGIINSTFVLGDTAYTGKINIISSFPEVGKTLRDTFSIYVTK